MPTNTTKEIMLAERILKALANRRRIAILRLLKKRRELSVTEVAEHIELSFKATSKHLNILRQNDILVSRQQSLSMLYQLSSDMPVLARDTINHISNSRAT